MWSADPKQADVVKTMSKPGVRCFPYIENKDKDHFFNVFKLNPPLDRAKGEKRHFQKTDHQCYPLTPQDVGEIAFDARIDFLAYDTPRLKMDATYINNLQRLVKKWYPGWVFKTPIPTLVAQGIFAMC